MDAVDDRQMKAKANQELKKGGQTPIEKIRSACLRRGINGIRGFGRAFRLFDDNGDRRLALSEFVNGCRDYGCSLNAAEAQQVFKQIDRDQDGSVNFDELLIALRPQMSDTRVDLINTAFDKMDKTGDGAITIEDLKGVYNCKKHKKFISGEWSEDQVFLHFLKTFESNPGDTMDGKITRNEFINYYSGVSASIDSDIYFDYMMRQAWKL